MKFLSRKVGLLTLTHFKTLVSNVDVVGTIHDMVILDFTSNLQPLFSAIQPYRKDNLKFCIEASYFIANKETLCGLKTMEIILQYILNYTSRPIQQKAWLLVSKILLKHTTCNKTLAVFTLGDEQIVWHLFI